MHVFQDVRITAQMDWPMKCVPEEVDAQARYPRVGALPPGLFLSGRARLDVPRVTVPWRFRNPLRGIGVLMD